MTTDNTSQALTDKQIIARLATEVMGWCVSGDGKRVMRDLDDMWNDEPFDWNPLTDWNHTVQVLQRMNKKRIPDIDFKSPDAQQRICMAALGLLPVNTCSMDGCARNTIARGWCDKHYRRWKQHGDPDITLRDFTPHGMTGTAEYRAWIDLRRRCNNPDDPNYASYGGRGITVCERWMNSFANFLEDMGEKPSHELSIERVDNNCGYSPENCKWATASEQQNNKRNSRKV